MYSNNQFEATDKNTLPTEQLEKLSRKLDKLGHEANFEDLTEIIS
jgi:hypothetical protein